MVLLTGAFEAQDDSRAAQVGADAQIAKPFEAQALVELVRGLIGSSDGPAPLSALVAEATRLDEAEPAPLEAPAAASDAQPGPSTGDTDFSFSDLEFAKVSTPDATQVMGGIPPLAPDPEPTLDPEPLDAPEFGLEGGIGEKPLWIDPIEPAEPQAPSGPQPLSPAPIPPGDSMTQPRLQLSGDDSLRPDADAVPEIDRAESEPAPADDGLAFDKTRLIDANAASELLEGANLETIPEEPIARSGSGRNPGGDPMLEPDAAGVDPPLAWDPEPFSEISNETLRTPADVQPLGEQTQGGSEIFGELLEGEDRSMGASVDEQTEADPVPEAAALGTARSGLEPAEARAVRDSIEKLAWDAFGPMSEQLVREVVKKIEEIAWDVVPQLAEKIVQQEIKRLTKSDD